MLGNPFIPKKRAKLAIVDGRLGEEGLKSLEKLGIEVIKTERCEALYESIAYHPDAVLHPISHDTLIVAPNVYDYYQDVLSHRPIRLIKGETVLKRNYPGDVAYNVARVSGYAIYHNKYIDPKLKFHLEKRGVQSICVNQGYAKCSVAVVDERSMITSDPSIFYGCRDYDIDALYIQPGFIDLPGLDYGFIGGCTGHVTKGYMLLTGQYSEHPDAKKISNFLAKKGIKTYLLSDKKIIDVGSIITLGYN